MVGRRFFGDVSLGDWLVAVRETRAGTPEARKRWAAECLQMPLHDFEALTQPEEVPDAEREVSSAERREAALASTPDTAVTSDADTPIPYGVVDRSVDESTRTEQTWLDQAPSLPEVPERAGYLRPALEPLFRTQTTRAILSTALATEREEGDVDLDRVLWHATHLKPLKTLPRQPVSTLRFGIQLLVDRGPGMTPYLGDQDLLIEELRKVAGKDRVQTLFFDKCPSRGCGSGGRATWRQAYEPPGPGTPAVLLTDLGIASKRQPGVGVGALEWLGFAKRVRGAQCPVLAIVPYAKERCPAELLEHISVLPWGRSTTVSRVRQMIGHGLRADRT